MRLHMKRLLMIDPDFPKPKKSVHHQDSLPIGLLKIGSYYQSKGWDVVLHRLSESYDPPKGEFDEIKITSLFTYWAKYVMGASMWAYRNFPNTPIEIGGIWASLMPNRVKELCICDSVYEGVMEEAEAFEPNYDLLSTPIDFQILHTSRGCNRRCKPCGVYCIEPQQSFISSIKDKIHKRNIVFYDNNLLVNPYIEDILRELILLKRQKKILHCESQSGFDGRILRKQPHLAKMLFEAGFKNPKIAWDGSIKSWRKREEEINILVEGGFKRDDISVFMLLNHDQSYAELEFKRMYCWYWRVQVTNCRFRPLDQLNDNFKGKKKNQTIVEYYIHPNWSDSMIKQFNRNVRKHDMSIRFRSKFHSPSMEYKKLPIELHEKLRYAPFSEAYQHLADAWNPNEFTKVTK